MATYKQELPPEGGYAPITYQRVPLKKTLTPAMKTGIALGLTALGWFGLMQTKNKLNNERIEMRCATLALRPLFEAEGDRLMLKQLKKNRDDEERIMKNVKGWEVGKWKHSPVFFTLEPDEYYKPAPAEYLAHSDPSTLSEYFYLVTRL